MSNGNTVVNTDRKSGAVPEGVHRFKIVDFEERIGPKAPYWNFTLEVEEGSTFDGQTVWANISLSDAARWKLEEFLDACTIPEGMNVTGDSFLGTTLRGDIVHDEYTQETEGGREETRTRVSIATFLPDAKSNLDPSSQKKAPAPAPVAEATEATEASESEDVEEAPAEVKTAQAPASAPAVKRPF